MFDPLTKPPPNRRAAIWPNIEVRFPDDSPRLTDAIALYLFMYKNLGQAYAIEIMKTVSFEGVRVFGDEEVKEVNLLCQKLIFPEMKKRGVKL